jgi:RNA polymerase sigma-70 factor, ECF subfamily
MNLTEPNVPLQELLEHRKKFVSFVEKRVGSKDDAEDIVQSAFIRGLQKGESIRDDESTVAWFYRVLRNAIIDHYRRNAARQRKNEAWGKEFIDKVEPDEGIRNEVCQCINPVLDSLKPEYRDTLRLVDLEDQPLRAVAEQSGISENNAAVRVHRARRALRQRVTQTCGACATHGCLDCTCRR